MSGESQRGWHPRDHWIVDMDDQGWMMIDDIRIVAIANMAVTRATGSRNVAVSFSAPFENEVSLGTKEPFASAYEFSYAPVPINDSREEIVLPKLVFTIAVVALCLAACQSQSPETPTQAVQSIITLYEARDFDALIRTRYAELSKAENEQQVGQLIERFGKRFAEDEALRQAVSVYESLLSRSPELSEDGEVATFSVEGGFVKLSKMPGGRWGFHL